MSAIDSQMKAMQILETISDRGIVQFTRFPHQYPMHEKGLSAIGITRDHRLVYTFTVEIAAAKFLENMQKWGEVLNREFPGVHIKAHAYQPFLESTEYFPARPEVVSYDVVVTFPALEPEIQPLAPYVFSQRIGQLGGLREPPARPVLQVRIPDSNPFTDPEPPKLTRKP